MRRLRRIGSIALLLALCIGAPRNAVGDAIGITVSPAKFEFSATPGTNYSFPITVRNNGAGLTHIQASLGDFTVTTSGNYDFQKPGTRPYSIMRWVSIRPREFDLKPASAQQVQFTIVVPHSSSLSGEYAGVVFFQTRPTRGPTKNSFAFAARVAAKIYMTIPGTEKVDGAITKMSSITTKQGQEYRVLFKNTGNMHVYLRGSVQVQQNGRTIQQYPMEEGLLVERGGDLMIDLHGKKLPRGTYQAIATIDYGGATETGGEIAFTVK